MKFVVQYATAQLYTAKAVMKVLLKNDHDLQSFMVWDETVTSDTWCTLFGELLRVALTSICFLSICIVHFARLSNWFCLSVCKSALFFPQSYSYSKFA